MAHYGRTLNTKVADVDARSINSFESDHCLRSTDELNNHKPRLYSHFSNLSETFTPDTNIKYNQYPPAYSSNVQDVQLRTRCSEGRPVTSDTEDGLIDGHRLSEAAEVKRSQSKWRRPWFCYIISVVQAAVFIGQCVHSWKLTGSPIAIKPSFNVMIGPSTYNSINMGARFVPCMKEIANITNVVTSWPCPNATTTAGLTACTLTDLCGNGALAGTQPTQWWRFIVPIFLHAGVVHIVFNLLVQLRLGAQLEMDLGAHILVPIYFAAGIGGYLFGGNFAGNGVTSTGASGAIFSIISLSLLDLLYHWSQVQAPRRGLLMLLADIIISFVLGLLPGVDNFSHIGGFVIGMLLGITLMRSPDSLDRRLHPYDSGDGIRMTPIAVTDGYNRKENTNTLFERRQPWWWTFSVLRVVCLVLCVLIFILLVKNFYNENASECSWCKYLSCLPVSNWCSVGDLTTTTTTTSS